MFGIPAVAPGGCSPVVGYGAKERLCEVGLGVRESVWETTDANGNVRFHAWQSALLFTAMFVLHLVFSWSAFLSWTIFVGDIGMIGYLTFRAYRDGKYRPDDYN